MSENENNDLPLSVQIEGLLFVAAEPVTPAHLAEALDVAPSMIEAALQELDSVTPEPRLATTTTWRARPIDHCSGTRGDD